MTDNNDLHTTTTTTIFFPSTGYYRWGGAEPSDNEDPLREQLDGAAENPPTTLAHADLLVAASEYSTPPTGPM